MRHPLIGLVLALVLVTPAVGLGQWLTIPTEGVPRNRDGTPNLKAPPPLLPNGKPDFSGIWQSARKVACTPEMSKFIECGAEIGGSPLAMNIGTDAPGGLPLQPWAAALVKQRTADNSKDDPHARCLPDNPPRTYGLPHMTKAVHTPKLLVLLYEVNAMYRQIFIDGRPLPEDPTPGWNGYSTGHWEGDTLVVQSAGFRDNLWIDTGGSPMSDIAKMTDRIRRPNFGTLEIELTIDDPKNYTKPFTVTMTDNIELDTELIDEFCLENEKSYDRMQRSRGK